MELILVLREQSIQIASNQNKNNQQLDIQPTSGCLLVHVDLQKERTYSETYVNPSTAYATRK